MTATCAGSERVRKADILMADADTKRKASEEITSPDSQQQSKKARTDSPGDPKVCDAWVDVVAYGQLEDFVG